MREMEPQYSTQDISQATLRSEAQRVAKYVIYPWWHACGIAAAVLALTLPVDLFERYPIAKSFSDFSIALFPFLANHLDVGQNAQVVVFVKSFSLLTLPVSLWGAWIAFGASIRVSYMAAKLGQTRPPSFAKQLAWTVVIAPLLFFGLWVVPGDASYALGLTTNSRWGLGLIEYLGVVALTGFVAANRVAYALGKLLVNG